MLRLFGLFGNLSSFVIYLPMIIGTGVDIIEISRIERALKLHGERFQAIGFSRNVK